MYEHQESVLFESNLDVNENHNTVARDHNVYHIGLDHAQFGMRDSLCRLRQDGMEITIYNSKSCQIYVFVERILYYNLKISTLVRRAT